MLRGIVIPWLEAWRCWWGYIKTRLLPRLLVTAVAPFPQFPASWSPITISCLRPAQPSPAAVTRTMGDKSCAGLGDAPNHIDYLRRQGHSRVTQIKESNPLLHLYSIDMNMNMNAASYRCECEIRNVSPIAAQLFRLWQSECAAHYPSWHAPFLLLVGRGKIS